MDEARSLEQALQETFLNADASRPTTTLSGAIEADSLSTGSDPAALSKKTPNPFAAASERALDSLFKNEFMPFLQFKIVRCRLTYAIIGGNSDCEACG